MKRIVTIVPEIIIIIIIIIIITQAAWILEHILQFSLNYKISYILTRGHKKTADFN